MPAKPCKDNKIKVQSRIMTNANFDFDHQGDRYVINYKNTDPSYILSLALDYLQLMSTSLCKVVVYCNRSNDEQLDAKITIKYIACISENSNTNNRKGNQNAKLAPAWEVRYNLPGTTYNSKTQRSVQGFGTNTDVIKFIFSNGRVNLIELHSKGVKVSDDKETVTLFYLPDV